MEQLMYGSTHTHFEDMRDTANNLEEMVLAFAAQGAKRVAVTGHGTMFALEDLKSIVKSLKDSGKLDEDFEILPGVEVYFGDNGDHMVLVAKNYEGYLDLCRVVTDSSANTKLVKSGEGGAKDNEYPTPLVTMENLRKNIRKGNVYATSACVGGVFCVDLGLNESKLERSLENAIRAEERKIAKKRQIYTEEAISKARAVVEEYHLGDKDIANKNPTKAEREKIAKKLAKNPEDEEALQAQAVLLQREQQSEVYKAWKQEKKPKAEEAKKFLKNYESFLQSLEEEAPTVTKAREALELYQLTEDERWYQAKELYRNFEEIFGKDDFYFELQNHTLPFEKTGFNNIVRLAYEVGNPHFIASNDVHVGDRKGSDTWERSLLRRDVEKFIRFPVNDDRGDREEYGIKNDKELSDMLYSIIEPYTDKDGIIHTPEEIISEAIGNIRTAMEPCKVVFPEISINGLNHYPKFCDDERALFKEKVEEGLKWRFPKGLPEGYRERVDYEMGIIMQMGFSGYHLIVQDYLEYGRLLGYLRNQQEIDEAPLTIEGLKQYIEEKHIPKIGMGIGPGRGSAAGSLVCYALGITDLDPIELGLLFERFLNPDRQSMPDIDSDFRNETKEKMYEYVKARYGEDCVSRLATKSFAHGKRALGIAQRYLLNQEIQKIEELDIPKKDKDIQKKAVSSQYIATLKTLSSKVSARIAKDDDLEKTKVEHGTKAISRILEEGGAADEIEKNIMETAVQIAGIPDTLGMHACGVLISKDPIKDTLPMAWNNENEVMTTQCLYPQAENLGMLKMDILALKNLTVITNVMQETGDTRLMDLEERKKIFNDKSLYEEIYGKGRTKGVFQVESPGMTKMMKNFQPESFEDIVILVAAYRPGPLDFVPEVIASKWWRKLGENGYAEKIKEIYPFSEKDYEKAKENGRAYMYDADGNVLMPPPLTISIQNEKLQKILEPTYGAPIYQEQVMEIFKQLAGYTPGRADDVRKSMAKKKMDKLTKERPIFIKGCMEREGISEEEASNLFDRLVEFGKYAFNKSHAACYAQVSVFTAYQKKEHPLEFYKYSMSNELKDSRGKDEESVVMKYMQEMAQVGIQILPPAIGKSKADVIIEGDHAIRLGFGNIKGESKNSNYRWGDSVFAFIKNNPDVSLTTVVNFAKLGMFDACWWCKDHEKEVERVKGNRRVMEMWVGSYGDRCKEYASCLAELDKRKKENEILDDVLKKGNISGDEKQNAMDTMSINVDRILILEEKKRSMEEDFIRNREKENSLDDVKPEQPDAIRDNREYEIDKLGFSFSTQKAIERIKKECSSKQTFSCIKNDNGIYEIPAAIVSMETKRSRKGNNFYRVTAMDTNGEMLQMTSFQIPQITDGIFHIQVQPSNGQYGRSYLLSSVDNFEKVKEKAPFRTVNVAGRTIPVPNVPILGEKKDETPLDYMNEMEEERI